MDSSHRKIALITGGSSGLGFAIAQQLSRQGMHICLVARHADSLEKALAAVRVQAADPEQCFLSLPADVSQPDEAQAAIDQVTREIGLPDLVINSAGVAQPGYFQDTSLDLFHWMMDVNYFGIVNVCKAVVPGMLDRGSGHIANISSASGFLGVYGYSAYTASKYAVAGFSEVLRAEMKPHGVHVSVVYPSDVDTPQLAYETRFQPPETRALRPLRSVMQPEAVAREVVRGIERKRYIILPGWDSKLMYVLTRLLGTAVPPLMDLILKVMVRRSARRGNA